MEMLEIEKGRIIISDGDFIGDFIKLAEYLKNNSGIGYIRASEVDDIDTYLSFANPVASKLLETSIKRNDKAVAIAFKYQRNGLINGKEPEPNTLIVLLNREKDEYVIHAIAKDDKCLYNKATLTTTTHRYNVSIAARDYEREEYPSPSDEIKRLNKMLEKMKENEPVPMPAYDDKKPHPTHPIGVRDDDSKVIDPNKKKGSRRPL